MKNESPGTGAALVASLLELEELNLGTSVRINSGKVGQLFASRDLVLPSEVDCVVLTIDEKYHRVEPRDFPMKVLWVPCRDLSFEELLHTEFDETGKPTNEHGADRG